MPRKVFFSFHYDDIWKVNIVRNCDVVAKQYAGASRFHDKSLWEEAKRTGEIAIKRLINTALDGSSVTCIVIGQQTWQRPWVRYEILKSFERGNGLFGVHIHDVGETSKNSLGGALYPSLAAQILTGVTPGPNPLDQLSFSFDHGRRRVHLYEWANNAWAVAPHVSPMAAYSVSYDLSRYNDAQFSQVFPVYRWNRDFGYTNFSAWVETAARHANR